MKGKRLLALALVLILALAAFSIPAGAEETHSHDDCCAVQSETIQPCGQLLLCPACGYPTFQFYAVIDGQYWYRCSNCPYRAPGPNPYA